MAQMAEKMLLNEDNKWMILQCATFSKSLNPWNINKSVADIRIRFPFQSRFWISVSGCTLTILPDIQPANWIVVISGLLVIVSTLVLRLKASESFLETSHAHTAQKNPDYAMWKRADFIWYWQRSGLKNPCKPKKKTLEIIRFVPPVLSGSVESPD